MSRFERMARPADQALVQAPSPTVSALMGFDPSRLEALAGRCRRLLHPQTGLCRGMILSSDKPHDRPDDVFPTTVGELLGVNAVLSACATALAAIAMEARRAETVQLGSVADDSAAIAQPHPKGQTRSNKSRPVT